MTGEAHWLDVAVVFGGGFLVMAVLFALMFRRHVRRRKLRFDCPVIREKVECTAVQNVETGQWQNIERCSAFTPPTNVNCQQACRDLMNAGDLVAR
jgi:hypothetical protein